MTISASELPLTMRASKSLMVMVCSLLRCLCNSKSCAKCWSVSSNSVASFPAAKSSSFLLFKVARSKDISFAHISFVLCNDSNSLCSEAILAAQSRNSSFCRFTVSNKLLLFDTNDAISASVLARRFCSSNTSRAVSSCKPLSSFNSPRAESQLPSAFANFCFQSASRSHI